MPLEVKQLLVKSSIISQNKPKAEELQNKIATDKCNSCMTHDSLNALLAFLIEAKGSTRER